MRRRAFILGSGAALAVAGVQAATGGTEPPRPQAVMPPGAGTLARLRSLCRTCGLCIAACPEKVLAPAGILDYGFSGAQMPKMNFVRGACNPACARCAAACPAGAIIAFPTPAERARQRIGVAEWTRASCRTATGEACTRCHARCPVGAIRLVQDSSCAHPHPEVSADVCVGCGRCENICPALPKAIRVRPLDPQEFSFGAATLVAYRRDGSEWTSRARGVKPLLDILDGADAAAFAGARCYDRIVGRAAAFLYAKIGVAQVTAPVMSVGAQALLARHGIAAKWNVSVPAIRNRAGDGICPMDASVKDLPDGQVEAAVSAVRATVARLRGLAAPSPAPVPEVD